MANVASVAPVRDSFGVGSAMPMSQSIGSNQGRAPAMSNNPSLLQAIALCSDSERDLLLGLFKVGQFR